MPPRERIFWALIISALIHFFVLLSFYGTAGSKAGPRRFPGRLVIELVNLATSGAEASVSAHAFPVPSEARERGEVPAAPPAPSLSAEKHQGEEVFRDRKRGQEEEPSSGERAGIAPGDPLAPEPDTSGIAPALIPPSSSPSERENEKPSEEENTLPAVFRPAQCASCPPPSYPEQALERGLEGEVVLIVQILPDGNVGDVYVEKSPDFYVLESAAIAAVKGWTFFPATENGEPVSSQKRVVIPFRLLSR